MTESNETRVGVRLLPCPFCGGEVKKLVAPLGFGNIRAAECSNTLCAVTGPWGRNEAEAIAAWNTRTAAEAASRAESEALREMLERVVTALPVLVAMLKSAKLGKGANVAIEMLDDATALLARQADGEGVA